MCASCYCYIPATSELIFRITTAIPGFLGDASGKKTHPPMQVDVRDEGLIPRLGRSHGGGL